MNQRSQINITLHILDSQKLRSILKRIGWGALFILNIAGALWTIHCTDASGPTILIFAAAIAVSGVHTCEAS